MLAAVTAILGIAVGRLWDSRAESARWRRDQKIASYQQLAEAFRSSYDNIQAIAFRGLLPRESHGCLPWRLNPARTGPI